MKNTLPNVSERGKNPTKHQKKQNKNPHKHKFLLPPVMGFWPDLQLQITNIALTNNTLN